MPFLVHGFGTAALTEVDLKRGEAFRYFSLVLLKQTHSDKIIVLGHKPRAKPEADAALTSLPLLLLAVRTADCLPILLVDEARRAIAAVHCGWRGTLQRIAEKAVRALIGHFSSNPETLLAALGPAIGPECYEVGEDVRRAFLEGHHPTSLFRPNRGKVGKYFLDLRSANRAQLLTGGLSRKNIFSLDECTHCSKKYFSYRRNPGEMRRLLNFIGLETQDCRS